MLAMVSDNPELLIGLALFVASELIGMSRLRDNSVLQLLLHMARELFPYKLERKQPPSKQNRPSLFRRLR